MREQLRMWVFSFRCEFIEPTFIQARIPDNPLTGIHPILPAYLILHIVDDRLTLPNAIIL